MKASLPVHTSTEENGTSASQAPLERRSSRWITSLRLGQVRVLGMPQIRNNVPREKGEEEAWRQLGGSAMAGRRADIAIMPRLDAEHESYQKELKR